MSNTSDGILFDAQHAASYTFAPENLSVSVKAALFETFRRRVDPIFKVSHIPTLRAQMLGENLYQEPTYGSPALNALRSAVCFLAVCSQSELECNRLFHNQKTLVCNSFRSITQSLLSAANLLVSSDLVVLQSFLLYLVSR